MSRQTIIDIATKEIGVTESPAGTNHTKYGVWFGFDKVAWCGIFCSWVYFQAGHPLGIVDFYKGFASVPFALKHWKTKITTNPQKGDLVCFDWNGDKNPDHVGIFLNWINRADGIFATIEGNTSAGNNSNGGQVQKRTRTVDKVAAFIDPLHLPA